MLPKNFVNILSVKLDKIAGFFHICTINNWQEVVNDLLKAIINSGLYDNLDTLYLGIVGKEKVLIDKTLTKIKVVYQDPDIKNFEFLTLEHLHNFCHLNKDFKVFYIHTKGVSEHGKPAAVVDWRNLMKYACLEQYKICLEELEKVSVVGVNWFFDPWQHFSGNFWWARASYISKLSPLPKASTTHRTSAEFWIGTGKPDVSCLHYSKVDHYKTRYPKNNYINRLKGRKMKAKESKPLMENKGPL